MAKTKAEKIAGIEEEIRQLENKKKRLIQEQKEQERKASARVTGLRRYGTLKDRAAVLKSVVSKPTFGVCFRLERVNRQPPIKRVFYMPFPLAAGFSLAISKVR